jgi:hypothetical protein
MQRCSSRLPWLQRFLQYRRVKGRVRHGSIRTQSHAGAEHTEEEKISCDGGPGSGEERGRHGHWHGLEAKREGVLVVRFEGRIEEGKTGCGGVERCPF